MIMGLFWLFLGLGLVFIILGIILASSYYSEDSGGCIVVVGLVCVTISIFIGIGSSDSARERKYTEKIELRRELVEEIWVVSNSSSSLRLYSKLYGRCESFDRDIEVHRRLYRSQWRGRLYSKEISEIEPTLPILEEAFSDRNP